MVLVTEQPVAAFDLAQVKRGDLLWAKHATWEKGKAGFVTAAAENQLIVQYYPGIGNVTNHFRIPVLEAAAGEWEIRWSSDLSGVQEYGIPAAEGSDSDGTQEGLQEKEDLDESGGADL